MQPQTCYTCTDTRGVVAIAIVDMIYDMCQAKGESIFFIFTGSDAKLNAWLVDLLEARLRTHVNRT